MLDKFFGIMRRAYYLIASLMTIGYIINGISVPFNGPVDKMDDILLCLTGAVLTFPIAILLHRISHWVVWGTINSVDKS